MRPERVEQESGPPSDDFRSRFLSGMARGMGVEGDDPIEGMGFIFGSALITALADLGTEGMDHLRTRLLTVISGK